MSDGLRLSALHFFIGQANTAFEGRGRDYVFQLLNEVIAALLVELERAFFLFLAKYGQLGRDNTSFCFNNS